MHVTTDMIPQYIAALKNAHLQASREEMPIPDNYLIMVVTKTMLLSERFPRANEYWEDIKKVSKLWMKWCKLYTKSDMKETIRIQAGGKESENFGGAALGGSGVGKKPPTGRPTPTTVEDLEGCFDIIVGVEVTGKGVLYEMVKSNTSLTITIATLTDTNARLSKKVETLTTALAKKGGGRGEVPGR